MANLFNPPFNPSSLSQDQQELLMAALASNRPVQTNSANPPSREVFDFASGSMESPMFASDQSPDFGDADIDGLTDQQFLDYLGRDNNFDIDSVAPGDLLDNEDSPGEDGTGDYDLHDKRKSPGDDGKDSNENGAKRREGDEKIAKKPGRKPLTSEPTSKRKAQNRAAQRAFRERKERHLKDLETKVSELEKSSESTSHENGLLRAQVEKLTNELKEYRKRLSLQTSRGSTQSASLQSFSSAAVPGLANTNFNFDFAQFGSPAAYAPFNNNRFSRSSISPSERNSLDLTVTNGIIGRNNSTDRSSGSISQGATPSMAEFLKSPHSSISADSPQAGSINGVQTSNLFAKPLENSQTQIGQDSPSSYNIFTSPQQSYDSATSVSGANSDSNASQTRLFQFKSTPSVTSSNSPSSHYNGPSSSCGTSPEPSGQAAVSGKDGSLEPISEKDGTISNEHEFCKELGKACGCIANPIPAIMNATEPESTSIMDTTMTSAMPVDEAFEFFNTNQAKDPFAPMSWADYPESNTALLGDGSFTGGFLSDISPSFEMQAPMDWNDLTGSVRTGLTPAFQKPNPMESPEQMLATVNEEVVPGENTENFVPCHKIWEKIQQRPDFKDGTLDIDSLCNELRVKAKCSETGVVIDTKDIDAALSRLPTSGNSPNTAS